MLFPKLIYEYGNVQKKQCVTHSIKAHYTREMENISRGPPLGNFVTIRTEGSMRNITIASTEYKSTESPLLNVMYCVRVSLWIVNKYSLRNTREKGVMGNLCISLHYTHKKTRSTQVNKRDSRIALLKRFCNCNQL
jgi:hypothetical protein